MLYRTFEEWEEEKKKRTIKTIIAIVSMLGAFFMLGIYCARAEAGDLSEHFSRSEFNQHRDPLPIDQVHVDQRLIEKLEQLRKAIGNRPIKINSGYRSAGYNQKVGGAKHSQHLDGKAADITVEGMTAKELQPIARAVGFSFTQTYDHLPHLHVDVR